MKIVVAEIVSITLEKVGRISIPEKGLLTGLISKEEATMRVFFILDERL